jgi:hypothetical protein
MVAFGAGEITNSISRTRILLDAMSAMRALRYAGRSRSARNIDLPLVRDLRVIL